MAAFNVGCLVNRVVGFLAGMFRFRKGIVVLPVGDGNNLFQFTEQIFPYYRTLQNLEVGRDGQFCRRRGVVLIDEYDGEVPRKGMLHEAMENILEILAATDRLDHHEVRLIGKASPKAFLQIANPGDFHSQRGESVLEQFQFTSRTVDAQYPPMSARRRYPLWDDIRWFLDQNGFKIFSA